MRLLKKPRPGSVDLRDVPLPFPSETRCINETHVDMPIGQCAVRSVIDRTGLTGNWEFELTFMPDPLDPPPGQNAPAIDPNAPSLLTALQEQLGLKLEPTKGSVEVLVVERVERPTEN